MTDPNFIPLDEGERSIIRFDVEQLAAINMPDK
jgi:hypothetical protein